MQQQPMEIITSADQVKRLVEAWVATCPDFTLPTNIVYNDATGRKFGDIVAACDNLGNALHYLAAGSLFSFCATYNWDNSNLTIEPPIHEDSQILAVQFKSNYLDPHNVVHLFATYLKD